MKRSEAFGDTKAERKRVVKYLEEDLQENHRIIEAYHERPMEDRVALSTENIDRAFRFILFFS